MTSSRPTTSNVVPIALPVAATTFLLGLLLANGTSL